MTITAQQVVTTQAFVEKALPEAINFFADKNGQPAKQTAEAYFAKVSNVVKGVDALMMSAAEETAKRMNRH